MLFSLLLLIKMLKIVKMDKDTINLLIESIDKDHEEIGRLTGNILDKIDVLNEHLKGVIGISYYEFYKLTKEQRDELLES